MRIPFFSLLLFIILLLLAGCAPSAATITWETASEVNTAGFNLYRGDTSEGPWQKINQQLIPPADDPIGGGTYQFNDTSAQPGHTYYYQLEEITLSGRSTQFDPILLKVDNRPSWQWWGLGILGIIAAGWFLGSNFRGRHA